MNILITGGAGFIGSALIRHFLKTNQFKCNILNYDKLTYAGNVKNLSSFRKNKNYQFVKGDICNSELFRKCLNDFKPIWIMHLAAESHVDRSIDGPDDFIQTNIIGTFKILNESLRYFNSLSNLNKKRFRFHHISTDEVYGDLKMEDFFHETTSYAPSSPYSASKASSDHLVRAWFRTYGLPIIVTNCSNNYGPYQYPEKLIPLVILNALKGKSIPVYGNGQQIRDWLYVEDHARALVKVINEGQLGETYNIGGNNTYKNIDIVNMICNILDNLIKSKPTVSSFTELIKFVADRPGHDLRYAIDCTKIKTQLGWKQLETFESGIQKTINWYIKNLNSDIFLK